MRSPSRVANGSFPVKMSEPFGAERNGVERGDGEPQRRPAASDDVGDVREHGAETHVLPTQNIPLADSTASQGGEVSRGHVVDVREIEAGVHKSRHAAARAFDDDAPGRRRLHVARADRRRGIDDDGREPALPDHILDQAFGDDLAFLVGADGLALRQRTGFVGRRAVPQFDRCDAAGIDDALDAGSQRLLHDGPRSVHVGSDDLVRSG